jgi:hypothetical protein
MQITSEGADAFNDTHLTTMRLQMAAKKTIQHCLIALTTAKHLTTHIIFLSSAGILFALH